MIEVKEIRIGNIVGYKTMVGTIKVNVSAITGSYVSVYVNSSTQHCLEHDYINPIQLTEENLIKFGFEEKRVGVRQGVLKAYKKKGNTFNISNSGTVYYGLKHIPIYYVHQLQNLYYALTGEELTIKN